MFTCLATTQQRQVKSPRDPGVVSLHVNAGHFSTTARRVTSPTWGPPPPCKQALKLPIFRVNYVCRKTFNADLFPRTSLHCLELVLIIILHFIHVLSVNRKSRLGSNDTSNSRQNFWFETLRQSTVLMSMWCMDRSDSWLVISRQPTTTETTVRSITGQCWVNLAFSSHMLDLP